ncbi:MAG: hypothetical protein AB8B60_10955 [Sulfitobacter sp.]
MEPEMRREIYCRLMAEWQQMNKTLDTQSADGNDEAQRLKELKKKLDGAKAKVFDVAGGGGRDAKQRRKARDGVRVRLEYIAAKMDALENGLEAAQ